MREKATTVDCLTKSKFAPIANVYKCVKCSARVLGTLLVKPKEPKQRQEQRQQLDKQSRVKRTSHSQPGRHLHANAAANAAASGTTAGDVLPWRLANELVW